MPPTLPRQADRPEHTVVDRHLDLAKDAETAIVLRS